MADEFQDMDLSGHSFDICDVDYSLLFKDFDCDFFARENMSGQLDFSECSLSDCFP